MNDKYQKYKFKYLNLKNKYTQLGGVIHIADEPGIDISRCEPMCSVCGEDGPIDYPLDQKIILNCECCVHISCILQQVRITLGDIFSLGPNGIRCPNSSPAIGTCLHGDVNISPVDLTDLFQRFPDINLDSTGAEIIDLGHFRDILATRNAGPGVVDPAQRDPYILATTKNCPTCQFGVTRYHGHSCHHISPGTGCPNCHHHFCYVCLSSGEQNTAERGYVAACNCTWQPRFDYLGDGIARANWSSYCKDEITEANISYDRGTPYDNRCGCFFCPECRRGRPCPDCHGTCVVCLGLVKSGPTELYRPDMGLWSFATHRKLEFTLITDISDTMFGDKSTVSSLSFIYCNFVIIKKEWLRGFVNLTNLEFDNCKIKSIEANSFRDLRNLTELKITNNLLKEISNTVNQCRNLIKLNLSNNKIKIINNNKFPNSLTTLVLTNNNINAIEDDAFSNLLSLEQLELDQNKIELIKPVYFTRLTRLVRLNLSNNKIKDILPLSFSNMDSLYSINISSNSLKTIKRSTFINLMNIRSIKLNGNKIKIMEEAVFDNCRLLRNIELASNHEIIVRSNSFKRLPKLNNIKVANPDRYRRIMLPNHATFI